MHNGCPQSTVPKNRMIVEGEIALIAENGIEAEWQIKSSKQAQKTINPIRQIVENMKIEPNPDKELITLSIGDPTKFGNMLPPTLLEEAMIFMVKSQKHNGYAPSIGIEEARVSVAKYLSTSLAKFTAKDVILACGCSDAIGIVISGLANTGDNILIPRPGFSLYKTIATPLNINVKYYNLLPHEKWRVDLYDMESHIDSNTRLMVVNNPSNPCGSVYTKSHLLEIIALARKYKIPILADEVYAHVVFHGNQYFDMSSLSPDVPILSCGGLTKRFIVPGWRLGWLAIHDPAGNLSSEARLGFQNLSQRIIGPNTLVQAAMSHALNKIPLSYFDDILDFIEANAEIFFQHVSKIPNLQPVMPQGAMYIMTEIDLDAFPDIQTDMEFVHKLMHEESVFCLPGSCFQFPGFFRSVLTLPHDKMAEACDRLAGFCRRHSH